MNINEILVVDDDSELLSMTGNLLTSYGYSARLSKTPEKALKVIEENPYRFCLILLDWKLNAPLDGDTLVEAIHYLLPDFNVPFIFITTHTHLASKHLIRLGAYDTLQKPFTDDTLIETVERALKKKPPEDPHRNAPAELTWQAMRKQDLAKKILWALRSTRSVPEAAKLLDCSLVTFHRWLKETGLHSAVIHRKQPDCRKGSR